jgi:hypothetical protein
LFPFVFKSVHLALVALKDEQIKSLRDELSVARTDRLRSEAARDAAVLKAFELLTPKPVEVITPGARVREPRPTPETLDLSLVDPTDNNAIRDLALNEMPSGKASANLLMAKMENIRKQVYAAIAAKSARAREVGTIEMPQSVSDQIDAAMEQGKQQARTQ